MTRKSTVLHLLQREWQGLVDFLLPPACPLCLGPLAPPRRHGLCSTCLAALPPLPAASCPLCREPYVTQDGRPHLCADCLRQPPPFAVVHAAGLYAGGWREAIHRFKFGGRLALDRALAEVMAQALPPAGEWELLLPVPQHPRRLRERLIHPSLLLARCLGRRLQLPVIPDLLLREAFVRPQQGLPAAARRQNVAGSFRAQAAVAGRRVLLVDDVMTTGATLAECSRSLLTAGAARVEALVAARASRHLPYELDDEGGDG